MPAVKLFCFAGMSLLFNILLLLFPIVFISVLNFSISEKIALKVSVYLIFYSELLRMSKTWSLITIITYFFDTATPSFGTFSTNDSTLVVKNLSYFSAFLIFPSISPIDSNFFNLLLIT